MAPSSPLIDDAAALHATLSACVPVLHSHCRDPWWLIGSAALHVAGVPNVVVPDVVVPDVVVHDIDVLVSDADAIRLLAHWHEHIDEAFQPERTDLFRSHFGRVDGFALPVEVMGDLQLFRDGRWQPVQPADRVMIEWRGLRVSVPSLPAQCAILECFGRAKDIAKAEAVRRYLRDR